MIYDIPHRVSDGLRRENEAHEEGHSGEQLARIPEIEEAERPLKAFLETAEGMQLVETMSQLSPNSLVLDIGPGEGNTSLLLAQRGHRVCVVEPSYCLCQVIEKRAEYYEVPITIYHVNAESLDHLPVRDFDACVFHASLHHCDDPVRALANCYDVLKDGGRAFLLNEPILQFYKSKKAFYRLLEEKPEELGHYGGNEHIYYFSEYLAMLREAGFESAKGHPSNRYVNPESYLRLLKKQNVPAKKIATRKVYYKLVQGLIRSGIVGKPALALLQRMSMLQAYFVAEKRDRAA